MRTIGSALQSSKSTSHMKPTHTTVSEIEKLDDAALLASIGQREGRTISMSNNSIYLSCGIRHFCRALVNGKQDVGILRGFIDLADWGFVLRTSISPTLQTACQPKLLARSLNGLLGRLESKRLGSNEVEDELCKMVAGESITALALCLFVRSLVYTWLLEHKQAQILENELQCVRDFGLDARGTVLRATANALDLNIVVWFQIGSIRNPQYDKRSYCPESQERVEIVLSRSKTTLVKQQTQTSPTVSKQPLGRSQSIAESEKKVPTKNCNKCGRVKLSKFCICRKQGQKQREQQNSEQRSMVNSGVKLTCCQRCPNKLQSPTEQLCPECKNVSITHRAGAVLNPKIHHRP